MLSGGRGLSIHWLADYTCAENEKKKSCEVRKQIIGLGDLDWRVKNHFRHIKPQPTD